MPAPIPLMVLELVSGKSKRINRLVTLKIRMKTENYLFLSLFVTEPTVQLLFSIIFPHIYFSLIERAAEQQFPFPLASQRATLKYIGHQSFTTSKY